MILFHFPQVVNGPFHKKYASISWPGGQGEFNAWKKGQTGFPIIDASMRALQETGLLHNRLRMLVASFLCKTLLVDWRKGEKYFGDVLLDYELSSNNGNWQWCASTGCDASPYFRIFNPLTQSKKFDPQGHFIRRFVPELKDLDPKSIHWPSLDERKAFNYPSPIVDYSLSREMAISLYKSAE